MKTVSLSPVAADRGRDPIGLSVFPRYCILTGMGPIWVGFVSTWHSSPVLFWSGSASSEYSVGYYHEYYALASKDDHNNSFFVFPHGHGQYLGREIPVLCPDQVLDKECLTPKDI